MATSFDITGRINAAVSSGSLRMLKKLQTELRATAKALMKMGETSTASALGHTAMALDKVSAGMSKVAESGKKVVESTTKTTKAIAKTNAIAKQSQGIYEQVAEGWKLNVVEAGQLKKAVGLLGKKYTYAANAQKEWVPTLKSALTEINKQKAALVASGKAITTHVSSQELFDRVNKKLASGLHTVSGKFTDYDRAMEKSLGRSPAFRKEVDKIAGAVGKQGESFKSQFAALTKADDLWRKHVTTLHRSGEITTKVAKQMYSASEHLNMPLEKLRANIKSTLPQVSLFGRAMSSLVAHLKSFASYAAAASIISGMAAIFGLATRAVVKYDQALHDLQAITRATDADVFAMGEKIREIGRTTKFSAIEVAGAMRTLGQAGFTAQEAIESIGAVANLATGTLTSMKTVVDLVTTAIRAFGLEATDTGRVSDIFANAVNRSKLTIDKLRIAFNYIGPIASKAGISLKETATTTMMLANAGVRASTIGTGLRRTIQQLISPSKELKEAMEAAGYTVDDLNPQMNDMRDIVRRLTEIVPDATAAFKLFSLRSSAAVAALSSQGVASFNALYSAVERSGSAAEMAETQLKGLGVIYKQAGDKALDLALALGDAGVNGALRILGKGLQMVLDGLRLFIESGIVKAIVFVGALTGALYVLQKAWMAIKMAQWAIALKLFVSQLGWAAAATEGLGIAFVKLQAGIGPLLILVAALYAAYKLQSILLGTKVKEVNDDYIDALKEIHKKETERLEDIRNLASLVRDELASTRKRSNALIELSEKTEGLNVAIDEETGLVKDLTGTIHDNVDALDKASVAHANYLEKVKIEKLEAQARLFVDTGEAIKSMGSKLSYYKKQSEGIFIKAVESLEKIPVLGALVGASYESMSEKVEIYQKALDKAEGQHDAAFTEMQTAVMAFGNISQEVWQRYMLDAGAAENEVVSLVTAGEEKVTRAHLEAYMRIQLARKDMTAAEKMEIEAHVEVIGGLFDKVNNITARRLEKGLRAIREAYSEEARIVTETYDEEITALRKQVGYTSGLYGEMVDVVRDKLGERLAILMRSYEDQKALIESYNLGMEIEQQKIAELDKKFANRKLALEKEVAGALRVLAEEQLELLTEGYKEISAAYDESVTQKIASIDRYYAYEKEKAELQITDAKVLAGTLVELESQRFDDLLEIGEQAAEDRLANEEEYHEESIKLIEKAIEETRLQYEEGSAECLKIEKDLNAKLIESDRISTKERLEILKGWSASLSTRYIEAIENTRRYANKVIEIENEIRDIRKRAAEAIVSVNESTQDKILRIHRAGLTERQLIISKIHEAHKKLAEADKLAAKGTEEALKQAIDLYGEVQDIYTDLGVEAHKAEKAGKSIGISHNEAAQQVGKAGEKMTTALEKVKDMSVEAKEAEVAVAKQAQKSWADLAEDIKGRIGSIQSDISDLTGSVVSLVSSIDGLEDKTVTVGADETKLNNSIRLVGALWTNINTLKDKTITVTTKYVEEHRAGGPVGAFVRGGKLPGFGGGDRVRALLEAGEFIVNKNAVRKYGTAMFDAYNGMMAPVKMAFGGFIGKKSGGTKGSFDPKSSIAGFSQIDDAINKLSKTINTLNSVSMALNREGSSFGMARRENETYGEFKEREQENIVSQDPLGADEFQISLPGDMRTLVADLKDSLKYVSGKDKESITEVVDLLTPAGIKAENIKARLSGRKLPKSEDVSDAVFNLEEERRDLEEKKEELAQYLEDVKKVREFYAEVRVLMVELSKLTVGKRPYSLGTNEPCWDYEKEIARIKRDYTNAKPILQSSGLDVSSVDSTFDAYLAKQQKLVSYQVKNTIKSREEGKLSGYFGEFVSRDVRVSRFDGKGKLPCWFYYPIDVCIKNRGNMLGRSAGNKELEMMDESESFKLELDKARQAANIRLANQKRETLRDLDSRGVRSSLRSEAESMREDLEYEPMEIPDFEPIQEAHKAIELARKGTRTEESSISAGSLVETYKKLAKKYFDNLPKFATGGFVDNILARLSPGEFVLKAEAVSQLGVPFLNALNNFKFPVPAFAGGGLVEGPLPAIASTTPSVQRDIQFNINITGAGEITEKQVRRWIVPAVDKIRRLER